MPRQNGGIDFANLDSDDYRYPLQDWYQIPSILHKTIWSDPYFDEGGGNIIMSTCSVPFYRTVNGKRKFMGRGHGGYFPDLAAEN